MGAIQDADKMPMPHAAIDPTRLPRRRERRPGQTYVKLTIDLWPELSDMLDNMADTMGVSKGEAIVTALGLLGIAVDAEQSGKKLIVVDDATGEEEEIVGISRPVE